MAKQGQSTTIESFTDRMADNLVKYAALPAKAEDGGISGALEMSCLEGKRLFALKLSVPLTRGKSARWASWFVVML
jgi:hypothetical protein